MNGQARMQEPSGCVLSAKVPTGIGNEKRCSTCQTLKSAGDYSPNKKSPDGLYYECKTCGAAYRAKRRAANIKNERERERRWRQGNPEACAKKREQQRLLYAANRKEAIEKTKRWQRENKEKNKETKRLWNKNNPEKYQAMVKRTVKKRRGTAKGGLEHRISTYMQKMLRGGKEKRTWKTLVDFNIEQLKKHLEKHFLPGMTWENRSLWHIDHIIPVSAFNYSCPEDLDFKRCWCLKNLQPLWKIDNMKKNDKLNKPFQPSLMIGGALREAENRNRQS